MPISDEQFVSQYLKHLDYHGSTTPCEETLLALHLAHIYHVPFENLDLLGDSFIPNLDRAFLFDKIVCRNRGGVCYELNTSFYYLLTAIGFDACQISGSVQPGENMFSHVATLVHLEDCDYIVDVGFGDSYVPPIKVGTEITRVNNIDYFMDYKDAETADIMRRYPGKGPERMYTIALTPRKMSDYFERFRWASAKGNTVFSMRPICASHTAERRITLRRGFLTIEQNGQVVESRPIAPGEETEQCLRDYFDLP